MTSAYAYQRTQGIARVAVRVDVFVAIVAVSVAVGWSICTGAYKVDQLGWLRWRSDELSQVAVAVNAPKASSPAIVKKTKEVAAQAKAAAYLGCPGALPAE